MGDVGSEMKASEQEGAGVWPGSGVMAGDVLPDIEGEGIGVSSGVIEKCREREKLLLRLETGRLALWAES